MTKSRLGRYRAVYCKLGVDAMPNPQLQRTMWERIIATVDEHNRPGVFTAFHGFEWPSNQSFSHTTKVVLCPLFVGEYNCTIGGGTIL
jgi:hypothetical protein